MVSITDAPKKIVESLIIALVEEIYQDGRLDEYEQKIMQRVQNFLAVNQQEMEQIRDKTLAKLPLDEHSGTFDKTKFFHKVTPLLLKHYRREEVAQILLEFAECLQIDSAQTTDRSGVQNKQLTKQYRNARELLKSGNLTEGIQILEKVARIGNPEAQYTLGSLYMQGKIIKKNHELARTWFQMAADNGHTASQGNLGIIYLKGMGVSKNLKMAFEYALSAARKGYPKSQFQIARSYFHGLGIQKNIKEAEAWYIKAANSGENVFQELADLYMSEKFPGGVQVTKASEMLTRGLKLGNLNCAPLLAILMLEKKLTEPNKALSLLKKSAERGHAESALTLGNIYSQGFYWKQDWNEALKYYVTSAQLGASSAYIQLGLYFQPGFGPGENSRLAALFFILADKAKQTSAGALLFINNYSSDDFSSEELANWSQLIELQIK